MAHVLIGGSSPTSSLGNPLGFSNALTADLDIVKLNQTVLYIIVVIKLELQRLWDGCKIPRTQASKAAALEVSGLCWTTSLIK